jgi:3-hydroxybutyrate dehydrogenase
MVIQPDRKLTVLITGAASGIGFGVARHLASEGHRVVVSDINSAAISTAVAELDNEKSPVRGITLDVTSVSSIGAAMDELSDDPIDVLINNAGLQHVAPLEDFSPDGWQHLISVMLSGAAMLTRAASDASSI